MLATEKRRFTVEDYRRLPADDWHYQLIDGEIVISPSPNVFHQTILGNLFMILAPHVKERGLARVWFAPLDLYLDDNNFYQPDVFFISRERDSILHEDGLHGAPDLVIEVLSPRTARYDMNTKRGGYALAGVREFWLVYPEARRVDVYHFPEATDKPVESHSSGATFSSPLFPELEISVDRIFQR